MVEANHLIGEIGDDQAGIAGAIVVGGVDAHSGAGDAVFAVGDACRHAFFRERAVAVVDVELVGLCVVADDDVGPAVLIRVEDGDAQAFGGGVEQAGFLRGVFEGAVAAIVPEADGSALVGFRRAVGFRFAVEGAVEIGFGRPLDVIGDDEIEMAVAIVVNPGGAGAEFVGA